MVTPATGFHIEAVKKSAAADYAKHLLDQLREDGQSYDSIAAELGISKPQVYGLLSGTGKGLGPKAESALAKRWHKGSVDAFRKASEAFRPTTVSLTSDDIVALDPFESAKNFYSSIELQREDSPETRSHVAQVVEAVRAKKYNLAPGQQMNARDWVKEFDDMDRELLRASNPHRRRQVGVREMTEEDLVPRRNKL
jgi:hypothetical protein